MNLQVVTSDFGKVSVAMCITCSSQAASLLSRAHRLEEAALLQPRSYGPAHATQARAVATGKVSISSSEKSDDASRTTVE